MNTRKEDIRHVLLKTARETFLSKGFKAVSMREISEKSGVELSNTYNYFKSKDVTDSKIERFIAEYVRFRTAEWKALFNVNE